MMVLNILRQGTTFGKIWVSSKYN